MQKLRQVHKAIKLLAENKEAQPWIYQWQQSTKLLADAQMRGIAQPVLQHLINNRNSFEVELCGMAGIKSEYDE